MLFLLLIQTHHISSSITPILFDGRNFAAWSAVLENSLQAKAKLGFLDGSLVRRDDSTLAAAWDWYSSFVKGWVMSSVETKYLSMLTHAKTAKDMYAVLKMQYPQENGPRIF